jgi:hypothetical protein
MSGVWSNPLLHPKVLRRALFTDGRFTVASSASVVRIAECSVGALGLPEGGTFEEVLARARGDFGLSLCPLELGPHLRLQYVDQPEGFLGQAASQHCAPSGSLTVACAPLDDDDETPKGFYLRRIEGVLWLRGYRSWPGHVWSARDVFAFLSADNQA